MSQKNLTRKRRLQKIVLLTIVVDTEKKTYKRQDGYTH